MLERTCPDHGFHEACIASDARFHWLSLGSDANRCGSSCGCGPSATLGKNAAGRAAGPFEVLSTCLALIEIVHSCNLACPTCYANSPRPHDGAVDAVPLSDIQSRIEGVIARKGKIEILQLSGGEPTLHPDLFELLAWAREHSGIDYLLINTNGVKLARDPSFAAALGKLFTKGGLQIYLQFDGIQEPGQQALRGTDLRTLKAQALANCAAANLPVTLAMTVTPDNLPGLWETIQFGLRHPHIHGITLQPVFGSGRGEPAPASHRLNTADLIIAAVEQSTGSLTYADFTPLPCGDPNCATLGYLFRLPDGTLRPISEFLDFARLQGFLQDKIHYTLADLAQCGCENEPLGKLLHDLEIGSSHTFRIMIKPFMDAWTWDEDRIDRCCTHVIRPDGKLDSFCRYYSQFPDTLPPP
jgi:uncharacterized radical SAM superfamily Fe-S cluster-containing enzyme